MKDTTDGWRGQLFWAAAIIAVAAGCGTIDGINNLLFGLATSPFMGAVMLFAAFFVVAIPAFAAYGGWCWTKRLVLAVAFAMTVWASADQYGVGQATLHTATQDRQDQYARAKERRDAATMALATLRHETGQASELAKLAAQADARFDEANAAAAKACKRQWLDICTTATADKKAAETKQTAAHQHLSNAQARDRAETVIADAEAIMNKGQTVVRAENPALVWLAIALTQGGALLGGEGFALLFAGLRGRRAWQQAKRKKDRFGTSDPDDGGGTKRPLPGNVVRLTTRRSVDAWLASQTVSTTGGVARGSNLLKAYRRWGEADANITPAEMRTILTAILGETRVQGRTSGYSVLGLTLRSSQAQPKKKAAAR